METVTHEDILRLISYDPDSGIFVWKDRKNTRWNGRYAGTVAGSIDADGYVQIRILGRRYKAHRMAWFYMTGSWPKNLIDHRNTVRTDNRFGNLRQADRISNAQNMKSRPSRSLPKGVQLRCDGRKYCAYIRHDGLSRNLGSFDTPELAAQAYKVAAEEHFGEFARTE